MSGKNRIDAQQGAGKERGGGPADYDAGASHKERAGAGTGADGQACPSCGSKGFKEKLGRTKGRGRLKLAVTRKGFNIGKDHKPSQFAQGSKRHGPHIGSTSSTL